MRTVVFTEQGGTTPRMTALGNLTLVFNQDGTVTANLAMPNDPFSGTLTVRHAAGPRARYHVALASIDAAIPGGGFAFVTVLPDARVVATAVLPDGSVFSVGTALRENGTIPLYSSVGRGVVPRALVGGELALANLPTTDLTGDWNWLKPQQARGVRGLHLGGVDTVLTANGSRFAGQLPLAGSGTLELSAGIDLPTETNAVTVTRGRPSVPTGALKAWIAYPRVGHFLAGVQLPGQPRRVLGRGVYLPKSQTAWGFFPGRTVGGRIELSIP